MTDVNKSGRRGRKPLGEHRVQVQIKNYPGKDERIISKSFTICNTTVNEIYKKIKSFF